MSNAATTKKDKTVRAGRQCHRRFAGTNGSAALEFALVAPILLLLIVGIIEFALVIFANVLLEGSVRDAARFGMTGQTADGKSREARIAEVVEENMMGLVTVDADDIVVHVFSDFGSIVEAEQYTDSDDSGDYTDGESFIDLNGNGIWDAGNGTTGAGGPSEVVVYRVYADWSMITPFVARILPNNGMFSLTASIALRNEPFDLSSGG